MYSKSIEIKVTFDFDNHQITLHLGSEIIHKMFDPNNLVDIGPWWQMLSIEHEIDKHSKWVFTWKEWTHRQQFFEFSKYTKPTSGRPGDPGYLPWSDLASWRHISDPQPGTIQTTNVYRTLYRKSSFREIKSLHFEVIGRPGKNWNTHNYITGGTGW